MSASKDYSAVHADPHGPGDARPTADQIIADEHAADRIRGKTVVITGASAGIGSETARALAVAGAKLILPVRDLAKGEGVAKMIRTSAPSAEIELVSMDMNDLDSVRTAAAAVIEKSHNTIHILINNAGVMAPPYGRTAQGFETQFGTNHLAHFLLFELLKPALLASSTAELNSRVINLSSSGHRFNRVEFDDLDFSKCGYQRFKAYGQSKTANIWMANEIDRRYGHLGLHALSVHPGSIRTELSRHMPEGFTDDEFQMFGLNAELMKIRGSTAAKSIPQGAATTILAAVSQRFEGKGGLYLEDCQVSKPLPDPRVPGFPPGHANWVYDVDGAKRLYNLSLQLVGLLTPQ